MILKLKKDVKKQGKCVCKETEKLWKQLKGKDSSKRFDTNEVLMTADKLEDELKTLREAINRAKEREYIERMGGMPDKKKAL